MNKKIDCTSLLKCFFVKFRQLSIIVSLTFVALPASAVVVHTTSSGSFDIVAADLSFAADEALITAQAWWGDDALAEELATLVHLQLPAQICCGIGVFFGVGETNDVANAPLYNSAAEVPLWHWYGDGGEAVKSYIATAGTFSWAVANSVPEINGSQLGIALTLLLSLVLLYREREGFQA